MIDASRIMDEKLTTIVLVSRDNKYHIIHSRGKKIGDVSVLVVEAISIREALRGGATSKWIIS